MLEPKTCRNETTWPDLVPVLAWVTDMAKLAVWTEEQRKQHAA
jgi:hypothetical protein